MSVFVGPASGWINTIVNVQLAGQPLVVWTVNGTDCWI